MNSYPNSKFGDLWDNNENLIPPSIKTVFLSLAFLSVASEQRRDQNADGLSRGGAGDQLEHVAGKAGGLAAHGRTPLF